MLGVNTILYSYLLFRTRLVPRPLALFGMVTAVLVFTAGLLEMFGAIEPYSAAKGFLALPVGVYEMSLAAWLIVKGFSKRDAASMRKDDKERIWNHSVIGNKHKHLQKKLGERSPVEYRNAIAS